MLLIQLSLPRMTQSENFLNVLRRQKCEPELQLRRAQQTGGARSFTWCYQASAGQLVERRLCASLRLA